MATNTKYDFSIFDIRIVELDGFEQDGECCDTPGGRRTTRGAQACLDRTNDYMIGLSMGKYRCIRPLT